MREGDWINIQSQIETSSGQKFNALEAQIIRITDKAILIEWDDFASGYDRAYKAWIAKSNITIFNTEDIEVNNQTFD